ncbi:response regulator transcription factor [Segetibacter sp.]|jgi:DNA-binding response OmpR family regulator|uniref:response regulator transcription factor n=1 Tax=Segetibacter sp. TaxID=2231182 RepID=UPI00261D6F01|nr:response regulator transcription factor [Segetibacter sp.]MCW3078620.1 DNA-binding response regulator [Segetibacter sp.]
MKILVVEDEKELSKSIVTYLKEINYVCEVAIDFDTAMSKIQLYDYDCILLDITLPDGSGLDIIRYLKAKNKMEGVLIISAKNSVDDRIEGLQLGADDYLPKPFHLPELSARVEAIIRRKNFGGNTVICFNEISIDTIAKVAYFSDSPLELTKKEYQLLLYLIANKERVISKNAIAEHLWGDEMDMANNYDFIYTHIKNLRKKLMEKGTADYLRSVYGMGYKFTDR